MSTTAPKTATAARATRRTFRASIRPRIPLLAAIGAVAALVAGCASATPGDDINVGSGPGVGVVTSPSGSGPTGSTPLFVNDGHCPSSSTDPAVAKLKADTKQVPLPADFNAVAVVRCGTETRTVAGDGEWQFADVQRADSKLTALLAALRLPSETPPTASQFACAAIGMIEPDFGLVDATGHVIRPQLPKSICGQPLNQVMTALRALPWRTETDQRLNQTQNQQEIDSGCYPQYKDVFELPTPASPEPWSQVRHPANMLPFMACIYTIKHGANGSTDTGDFVGGTKLDSARQATIDEAMNLNADDPAPLCTSTATRFAMLSVADAGGVVVELDGCQRVLWPNGFTSSASDMLIEALTGLGRLG